MICEKHNRNKTIKTVKIKIQQSKVSNFWRYI